MRASVARMAGLCLLWHRTAGDHPLLLVLRYHPGFAHQRSAVGGCQFLTPASATDQTVSP